MSSSNARLKKLRALIKKSGADAALITNFANVTYLTGFTGDDSYLVVTATDAIVLSDSRYTIQLGEECPHLELVIRGPGEGMVPAVSKLVRRARLRRLAVEGDSMTLSLHAALESSLERCQLTSSAQLVEQLRVTKDKHEVASIRRACTQARRAFEVVRASLTPDLTEKSVAADLEHQARRFGAKGLSFPPIVAVGARAALPHANPTEGRIGESPFTLFDWGANEGLYVSDLTRVLVTGKIPPKLRTVYGVVLKAQRAAIRAIAPGVTCDEADQVARRIISKAGYGKYFGHGLGHGIGLEIHEAPALSRGQPMTLKPGMIVTVEPGVYLPGWGGVRIEDDVLVTRDGCEVLTDVPVELEECVVR